MAPMSLGVGGGGCWGSSVSSTPHLHQLAPSFLLAWGGPSAVSEGSQPFMAVDAGRRGVPPVGRVPKC